MSANDSRTRQLITEEAARIILEEGVVDYRLAKRKAAERLGATHTSHLPKNTEIEAAVLERQGLFEDENTRLQLKVLRESALQAMYLLEAFSPRLVGSVLSGIVNGRNEVTLHAFADSAEEIIFLLHDAQISWHCDERRIRQGSSYVHYPSVCFGAGGVDIEVIVFPIKGLRQPPLSPIDGKPMKRAGTKDVEMLLKQDTMTALP